LHLADPVHFRKGQVLFSQGRRTHPGFYWLKTGRVKFSLLTNEGAERVVGFAGEGAIFGEESILDGEGCAVMGQALTSGVAYLFSWSSATRLLRAEPDLAIVLLEAMARKLHLSLKLIEEMSFLGVRDRVVQTIARLAGEARFLDLSHQELAGLVGASRVMVSHVLAELREEGLIEQRRRRLVILDPERLFALKRGQAAGRGPTAGRGQAAGRGPTAGRG